MSRSEFARVGLYPGIIREDPNGGLPKGGPSDQAPFEELQERTSATTKGKATTCEPPPLHETSAGPLPGMLAQVYHISAYIICVVCIMLYVLCFTNYVFSAVCICFVRGKALNIG